jgi:hypothetical protein
LVFNKPYLLLVTSKSTCTFFLTTTMTSKSSEREENTPKETPRSTATELDKVRNFESEKRNKLITTQDELDTTQELLNKNTLEETRSTSVKKTEERLLNMVKIQEGNLERATAAWRLAHEVLKETEARLRAGSAVTPTATTDRPSSAAAPRPHFMALSFLRCPETN